MIRPKIADTVPQEDWQLFEQIRWIISELPEILETNAYLFGIRLSRAEATFKTIPNCHVFTRALAKFLPVDVHDGFVVEHRGGKAHKHDHSWLTRKGGDGRIIIDPWPLGVVSGPALFIQDYAFHFGPECSFLHTRTPEFVRDVAALRLAIRKVVGGPILAKVA
jgi:hypothetical protein